ncbi:hypothetical protein BDN71DRAFT_1439353 [Pleurotus eryngii]|uniref:Uncharacterized protein n=1 Tax=Pleurotus eryngii TaxID=5323 RepID=A0A9P6AAW3_PLEER|nr:hypothetical protein BDN71DRAFT_1439353 [Pleurotus eryngii]
MFSFKSAIFVATALATLTAATPTASMACRTHQPAHALLAPSRVARAAAPPKTPESHL